MSGDAIASARLSRRQLLALDVPAHGLAGEHWIHVYRAAMACRFEVVLPGEAAADVPAAREALDEADRLEAALSVFRDTSELSRVNRGAAAVPVPVSEELFDLLRACGTLWARTGGAFDITSTPLSRCWGFLRREGRLPPAQEIAAARDRVGMARVELDPRASAIRFRSRGVELNLGGIGKGYALDCMGALLRRRRVRHALISAGGSSILAIGGGRGGWSVDVRSRQVAGGLIAHVRLRDCALATSGAGEQFVEIDGIRYGHVLDPRTGWPARGILSASVITGDAAIADALSTAFLVGGAALARLYCSEYPDTLVVLTTEEDPGRPRVFGSYDGATLEDAACS